MITWFRERPWGAALWFVLLLSTSACESSTSTITVESEDGGTGLSEIHGTLIDSFGAPCPGMSVLINERAATTDAKGEFTLSDVPEEYDATLVTGGNWGQSIVYTGLSSRRPKLRFLGMNPATFKSAHVQITTPELDTSTVVAAYMIESAAVVDYIPGQGQPQLTHSIPLHWTEGESVHAKIYAFQVEVDPDTKETLAYLQFAEHEVDLREGEAAQWQVEWRPFPFDVTLAEVDFESSSSSAVVPSHAILWARFGDSPHLRSAFRLFSTPQPDSFVLVPKIPDVHYDLDVTCSPSHGDSGATVLTARDIASSETSTLELEDLAPKLKPLAPGTVLEPGLRLSWTQELGEEAVVVLAPELVAEDAPWISFYVRGSDFVIPDLGALGLALPPNTPYAIALNVHSSSLLNEIEGEPATDGARRFAYTWPIAIRTPAASTKVSTNPS